LDGVKENQDHKKMQITTIIRPHLKAVAHKIQTVNITNIVIISVMETEFAQIMDIAKESQDDYDLNIQNSKIKISL
jgi:hypothetical protein